MTEETKLNTKEAALLSVELVSDQGVTVEISGSVKKEPEVKKISLEELPFHELKRALKEKENGESEQREMLFSGGYRAPSIGGDNDSEDIEEDEAVQEQYLNEAKEKTIEMVKKVSALDFSEI